MTHERGTPPYGWRRRGVGWRWFCPPSLFIKTDTWLGNNDQGLVIGKPPWQRALSPTVLPKLLACQSPYHAPLWCRGKWVVGVGPLITSSREHRPPWGMRRVTLLSSLNKIFICYFFPPWLDNSIPSLGGEHAHHPTDKDMSLTTGQQKGVDLLTSKSALLDCTTV